MVDQAQLGFALREKAPAISPEEVRRLVSILRDSGAWMTRRELASAFGGEEVADRKVRAIAEAIAHKLDIPAESRPPEEFGMPLSALLAADMPASSALTQELLGWKPTHPGLIEDIELGHYFV